MLNVAAVQHDIKWEDSAANIDRFAGLVADAASDGAGLVVFSEMFTTGFSLNADRLAEPPDGPTTAFLVEQAAKHSIWVSGSLPELTPGFERPTRLARTHEHGQAGWVSAHAHSSDIGALTPGCASGGCCRRHPRS